MQIRLPSTKSQFRKHGANPIRYFITIILYYFCPQPNAAQLLPVDEVIRTALGNKSVWENPEIYLFIHQFCEIN
jgi:hypothetical protein